MSAINFYPLAVALMLLGKYYVPLRAELPSVAQKRSPRVLSQDQKIPIPRVRGAIPRKPSVGVPVVTHTILM